MSKRFGAGYRHFEDFVDKYIGEGTERMVYKVSGPFGKEIWSDETRDYAASLLGRGIPANLVGRLLKIPEPTVKRWNKAHNRQQKTELRRRIICEWYIIIERKDQQDGFHVTLDKYVNEYGDGLIDNINLAVDMLLALKQCGITFPYKPMPRDARLFGLNHGNGSLNSNLTLQFTGNEEALDIIDSLVPLDCFYRKDVIIYSPALGRLYHLMGLPKGNRQNQELSIPDHWIKGDEFVGEFLGGLFDTATELSHRESRIVLRQFAHLDYEKSFRQFIEAIASMYRALGIELTEKGEDVKPIRNQLVGKVMLVYSKENMARIMERLRPMFRRSMAFLEQGLNA